MSNCVKLEFEKSLVGLAANPFGKSVFKKQVEGKLNEEQKITIIFPERIERIASSFVQGFFSQWIDKYGVEWVRKNIDVSVSNEELKKTVYENLE